MKIRFVARKGLQDFKEGYKSEGEQLLLFGFEGLGAVSYEKELKGESVCFEDTALLSKEACAIVVSGCVTEMGGIKRKSAVVAERGKLLGVSDVTYTIDGHGNPGGALRVYDTKLGRMGVLVAEDLFFSDTTQALSLCGSDFLVCAPRQRRNDNGGTFCRVGGFSRVKDERGGRAAFCAARSRRAGERGKAPFSH